MAPPLRLYVSRFDGFRRFIQGGVLSFPVDKSTTESSQGLSMTGFEEFVLEGSSKDNDRGVARMAGCGSMDHQVKPDWCLLAGSIDSNTREIITKRIKGMRCWMRLVVKATFYGLVSLVLPVWRLKSNLNPTQLSGSRRLCLGGFCPSAQPPFPKVLCPSVKLHTNSKLLTPAT